MNFEKLEALVSVMNNEQYSRFELAVFSLIKEQKLFSKSEIQSLEDKIQKHKQLEREKLMVVNN